MPDRTRTLHQAGNRAPPASELGDDAEEWLKNHDAEEWLKNHDAEEWLKNHDAEEWLKNQEWLKNHE